jgi:hypothetical protein
MSSAWNFNETSGPVVDYAGVSSFNLSSNTVRTADGGGRSGQPGDRGLTQSASATQAVPLPVQSAERTIACSVRQTAAIAAGWAMEYNNADLDTGICGLLWLSGTLRFRVKDASNSPTEIFNAQLADNTWHDLVCSYDGDTLRFFIDGVLGSRSAAFAGPIWAPSNTVFRMLDTTGSPLTIDNARVLDFAVTTEPDAVALASTPIGAAARTDRMLAFF